MTWDREGKVAVLKQQIEDGDYRVDPYAVADALLWRLEAGWTLLDDPAEGYSECSYPDSSASQSRNSIPPCP
jgi:hypothetical protein